MSINMNYQSQSKDELLQELQLLKSKLDSTLSTQDQLIAEFKKTEDELRQSEERLRYAIEGATNGIWDWDITNSTVFFSKQWKSMLGYEETEIGNTLDEWNKRIHQDDLDKTLELVNCHLNGEIDKYASEHRIICKDGSFKWILDEGKVVSRDADGKALRAIGTHKDITSKKQIIDALLQSEERYKSLFHGSVSILMLINPETGDIIDANNAACKFYNWSHDEICSKKIFEINIMSEEELSFEMNLAKEEKRNYFNFKHRLSNGEIRDVEVFSGPVKFNDVTLLYSQINDVTARKKTENALKESEERLNTIIQSQVEGIGFVNKNEVFEFANQAACKIFETEIDELIGKSLFDFLGKTEANNIKQHNRDRKKGIANNYEIQIITKKGIKYLYVSGAPKFDSDKNFIGTYGVFGDITSRKLAEIALHESEEKFSKAFQTSPYAISISTIEDGKFIEVNDAFTRISGYSMEEVITDQDFGPKLWENIEDRKKIISTLREGKDIVDLECVFKKKNGEIIIGQISAKIIYLHNEAFILSSINDISERKQAENEIKGKSALLTNLLINLQEGILLEDSNRKIILTNQLFCDIFSIPAPPSALVGVDCTDSAEQSKGLFKNPEKFLTDINHILEDKKIKLNDELELNDGRYFERDYIPTYHNTYYTGHLWKYRDITERKQAEAELRKLSLAVEQSPVMTVITGISGTIQFVNQKTTELTGFTKQELIGKNTSIFGSGEKSKGDYAILWDTINSGREWKGEFHNKKKSGELYWVAASISPIFDNSGKITHYLAIQEDITERKLNEEALHKNEIRFTQITEQSQTVIWEVDATGLYTYVSPVAKSVWKYNPDELIGKLHFYDLHPVEDREAYKSIALEMFKRKKVIQNFINPIVTKDGNTIYVTTNRTPLIDKDDNLLGYRGADNDITDRRNAEEALRKSEAELNYAQEIAGMGSWHLDLITSKLTCSENYYRLIEQSPDNAKISMHSFKKILHPDDLHLFEEKLKEIRSDKKSKSFELRILLPEGKIKWVQNNIVPVFDWDTLIALNGVIIDITQKKQAEELILSNQNELTSIVNSENIYIIKTDLAGNYTFCNKKFMENFGFVFDGKPLQSINSLTTIHPDDHEKTIEIVKKCLEKPETSFEIELRKPLRNGKIMTELWQFMCRLDANQKPESILCVGVDITARKKAEKDLHDMNANLEKMIEERTLQLELTNTNLLQEIETRSKIENALTESEYNYRTVVENVKEIIFRTDSDGRCVFLNSAWEEITGFSVEESIGQLFINYIHPDDRQRTIDLFTPLINREKEYSSNQIRFLTKDGSFRWVELFSRLGLDPNDEITGAYGTLQDITERKMAEDFENELLQLSPKLTGLPLHEINSAINLALSRIGIFLVADRAYIFEFNHDKTSMDNTFEWCNEGIHPEIDNLKDIPCEIFPIWMETLNRHENIIIPSVADLPESWQAEREILEPQGIQSLIVMPMIVENNLIGFVGLDVVVNKKEYNAGEVNILKVWSSMLASLINNHRIENLLEQTRQNYETFFNTIDDFLFVLDEKGGIIHTNDTVNNRLEYSNDELTGKSVLLVHPAERRDEAGRIVGEMLAGVTDFCHVPLITKSGNPIAVETRVKAGYWDGKPVIFGVSKDITKIKKSEEKFAMAFQSNSALMAISGFFSGEYFDVNNSFLKTLGFKREEVIGKSSSDLNIFVEHEKRKELITLLEQKKPVQEFEIEIRKKDGEILTGLFSAELIYIENELSLLTVMIDITERKKYENEIKQARNEAEQANIAKSEFLSRMSHELRTPLNSILGFAQLMEMDELDPEQKRGIGHIMRSGKHLLNMINEVLDISRIEAGRLSLSLEPVSVFSILNEMIEIIQPLAINKHVNICALDFQNDHIFVKADRQRLIQVLLNLFNNAIKYNVENGNVSVIIEEMQKNYAGIMLLRISIKDTGIGISDENIIKLFNPFERIGADKTQTEGTGLGLAVSKKLILAMQGNIGVDSNLNVGSTFWIELPMIESQLESLVEFDDKPITAKELDIKRGTILYIEDNLPNIELVEQVIDSYFPNIRLISNITGLETVYLAKSHKPDLILLDLNLPDIHGSEVMNLLQSDNETNKIPVVIISADASPKQYDLLLKSGASRYLTKPLDIHDLLNVINEYI